MRKLDRFVPSDGYTALRDRDMRLLLRVARAADRYIHGQSTAGPLSLALDALNKPKAKR